MISDNIQNIFYNVHPKKKSITVRNYFLVFTVFGFSIYMHFTDQKEIFLAYTLLLGLIYVRKHKFGFDKTLLISALYIFIVALLQTLIFGTGRISTIIYNVIILLFFPYFVLNITGLRFIKIFSNIIVSFAFISLIFWVLTNYYPGFHDFTYRFANKLPAPYGTTENEQFYIYTYEKAISMGFIRNPGPTYEPGNWSVYLILALIINLSYNKRLFRFSNIIIILSLITTFSSAGYIGLFLILGYYFALSKANLLIKILFGPLAIYAFLSLYSTLDFMESKIEDKIENESTTSISKGSGRILGARRSWNVVKKYPLTGRGFLSATKADPLKEGEQYADYGFPSLAASIGIIGFIFYFSYLVFSFYRINQLLKNQSGFFFIFSMLALLVQLFSQASYSTPVFVMLFLSKPILDSLQQKLKISELKSYNNTTCIT